MLTENVTPLSLKSPFGPGGVTVMASVGAAARTSCAVVPTLDKNPDDPLYVAWIVYVPDSRDDVEIVATPDPFTFCVPMVIGGPLIGIATNVTAPTFGGPAREDTVAVNVTEVPTGALG